MNAMNTTATISNADLAFWADGVINHYRFACAEDRILARYEETDTVMPDADQLTELGFDVVGLAQALDAGLDPAMFGKAYLLVDVAEFNLALERGLDIALYNEGMAHLADMVADGRLN